MVVCVVCAIRFSNRHIYTWTVSFNGRQYEFADGAGSIQCYEFTPPLYRKKVFRVVYRYMPAFAILPPYLWFISRKKRLRDRRLSQGLCPQCGYNLTGNASGVCPECGTPISEVARKSTAAASGLPKT
jgi:hypothetical protein